MLIIYALLLIALKTQVEATNLDKISYKSVQVQTKIDKSLKFAPIIRGENIEPFSRPYQVLLNMYIDGWYMCSGSKISQQWILTAAHCVISATKVNIYFCVYNRTAIEPKRFIKEATTFFPHSQFNWDNLSDDIGLVKFAPDKKTNKIPPILLPSLSDAKKNINWRVCNVCGWGITSTFTDEAAEVITCTNVKIVPSYICKWFFDIIKPSMVCSTGYSTCNGDSGGPLVYESKVIGIVSFSSSLGCESGVPVAYTRVTSYLKWIENEAKINVKP